MTMFSIPDIQSIYSNAADGTKTGVFDKGKADQGTFSLMVSHYQGATIYDRTTDYADGKSVEQKTAVTKNADGTYSEAVTTTVNGVVKDAATINIAADGAVLGKTSQLYRADGSLGSKRVDDVTANADGSKTDDATVTLADGKTETIQETFAKLADGMSRTELITNADGQTKTINYMRTTSDGKVIQTWSGVGFDGKSFSRTVSHPVRDPKDKTVT